MLFGTKESILWPVSPSIRFQTQGIPPGLPRILAAIAALALLVLFFSVGAVLLVVLAAAGLLLAAFHSLRRMLQGKSGPLSRSAERSPGGPHRPSAGTAPAGRSRRDDGEDVIEVEVVEGDERPHSASS